MQTVITTVVSANRLVNGTSRFLDPRGSKIPEPIDIKLDRGDYVGSSTHMQTLVFLSLRGAVVHMREIVIIRVYFYTPLLFDLLRTCRGRTV